MIMEAHKIERFWSKVEKTDSCWMWNGYRNNAGYGVFYDSKHPKKKNQPAHRVSYLLTKGEIPEGLVLDHLCRVPPCVNPDHLEPVTIAENIYRGIGPASKNRARTHCKNGHEFNEENTHMQIHRGEIHKGRMERLCKPCHRVNSNRDYHKRMAIKREARKLEANIQK